MTQSIQGIRMLEMEVAVMVGVDRIHPTLLWDQDGAVLIDTGYPGALPLLRQAIEHAGVPFERIRTVVISHQDLDHIGGLPALRAECGSLLEVLSSEIERPYIQGEQRLVKLSPEAIERAMSSMPEGVPEQWRQSFRFVLENPPKAPVDRTIGGGDLLPYAGGLTVISTPGHTPGHLSFYHHPSKTLIAADAMIVKDGQLYGPDPQTTADLAAAQRSLRAFSEFDIAAVICYHGGKFDNQPNSRIAELIRA